MGASENLRDDGPGTVLTTQGPSALNGLDNGPSQSKHLSQRLPLVRVVVDPHTKSMVKQAVWAKISWHQRLHADLLRCC